MGRRVRQRGKDLGESTRHDGLAGEGQWKKRDEEEEKRKEGEKGSNVKQCQSAAGGLELLPLNVNAHRRCRESSGKKRTQRQRM